ncbi:aminotransferase class V-fold PLP-dependent enzyme [Pontibacter sp. G13]|uniref:aminotransferase class V-fold PLP-dependent enzyme n=1 Tax=Pontibacter sp. G13 TaxID=3074898 RepID=UPI00288C42D1|nr:aminotransferase class V-fold PLP-dependent enzyme [Pontibacter sp. G13]WNJ17750.1 aminotransferase class V-fold PLP-dependent enzyme [Pontibacter sp. G13]
MELEAFFSRFRRQIIGVDHIIQTPYHDSIPLLYADWTASGRMYQAIEDKLQSQLYPLVANTHTDTNHTGMSMTYAYHRAQQIIKQHVGANSEDVLISSNSGMTGVVNKLQRILGLKLHESFLDQVEIAKKNRPVVFVTHMEHHSNQTTWYETIAEVVVVPPDEQGLVAPENFRSAVASYADRQMIIAAITSCSNVTGIMTPYMEIAQIMHEVGGYCFVDFACSAPYIDIDMHASDDDGRYLDAIYFSPHKFLGGPGSSGILIFNRSLYHNRVPDNPGGGTVDWTNPWGQYKFVDDIEAREDGGTPAFLQTIRTAMCCQLKEKMGVDRMLAREEEMLQQIWPRLDRIPNLHVLASEHRHRLGVISFYIDGLHYHLGVKMLNDRFGIQTRGGCSCAGTYGHFLLNVSPSHSREITDLISQGDCSTKPGWIRMSIHPTMTDADIQKLCDALEELAGNFREWQQDYVCDFTQGRIEHTCQQAMRQMEAQIDQCLLEGFA